MVDLLNAKKVLSEGGRYTISSEDPGFEMRKIESNITLENLQKQMNPGDYLLTMKKGQIYLTQIPTTGSGFHQADNMIGLVLEKLGLENPSISSEYGIDIIK